MFPRSSRSLWMLAASLSAMVLGGLFIAAGIAQLSPTPIPMQTPIPTQMTVPAQSFASTSPEVIEAIRAEYADWNRLNEELRRVSIGVWIYCRPPTEAEHAFNESEHNNDTYGYYMNDYVNNIGFVAMTQEINPVFPVGTIIVKEKLGQEQFTNINPNPAPLGIMIKREAGFNPEGGDWEYIYWEPPDTPVLGVSEMAHCQSCHMGQRNTDSVFRPYVTLPGV